MLNDKGEPSRFFWCLGKVGDSYLDLNLIHRTRRIREQFIRKFT